MSEGIEGGKDSDTPGEEQLTCHSCSTLFYFIFKGQNADMRIGDVERWGSGGWVVVEEEWMDGCRYCTVLYWRCWCDRCLDVRLGLEIR